MPRLPQTGCSWSCDLFKFLSVSIDISETVQDRDSYSGRLIGSRVISNDTNANYLEWL